VYRLSLSVPNSAAIGSVRTKSTPAIKVRTSVPTNHGQRQPTVVGSNGGSGSASRVTE